jgi:uncharacterized protein YdiU (UPF0061 family)
MGAKLGISDPAEGDGQLISDLLDLMAAGKIDFTKTFRALGEALRGRRDWLDSLFSESGPPEGWLSRWRARLKSAGTPASRADAMDHVNPAYLPRNHLVEEALEAAEEGLDLEPARELLEVLSDPFTPRQGLARYAEPAPSDFGPYVTFCGT